MEKDPKRPKLKLRFKDDIRRIDLPQGYEEIVKVVEDTHKLSRHNFALKYKDEEDWCTLVEATLPDAIALAQERRDIGKARQQAEQPSSGPSGGEGGKGGGGDWVLDLTVFELSKCPLSLAPEEAAECPLTARGGHSSSLFSSLPAATSSNPLPLKSTLGVPLENSAATEDAFDLEEEFDQAVASYGKGGGLGVRFDSREQQLSPEASMGSSTLAPLRSECHPPDFSFIMPLQQHERGGGLPRSFTEGAPEGRGTCVSQQAKSDGPLFRYKGGLPLPSHGKPLESFVEPEQPAPRSSSSFVPTRSSGQNLQWEEPFAGMQPLNADAGLLVPSSEGESGGLGGEFPSVPPGCSVPGFRHGGEEGEEGRGVAFGFASPFPSGKGDEKRGPVGGLSGQGGGPPRSVSSPLHGEPRSRGLGEPRHSLYGVAGAFERRDRERERDKERRVGGRGKEKEREMDREKERACSNSNSTAGGNSHNRAVFGAMRREKTFQPRGPRPFLFLLNRLISVKKLSPQMLASLVLHFLPMLQNRLAKKVERLNRTTSAELFGIGEGPPGEEGRPLGGGVQGRQLGEESGRQSSGESSLEGQQRVIGGETVSRGYGEEELHPERESGASVCSSVFTAAVAAVAAEGGKAAPPSLQVLAASGFLRAHAECVLSAVENSGVEDLRPFADSIRGLLKGEDLHEGLGTLAYEFLKALGKLPFRNQSQVVLPITDSMLARLRTLTGGDLRGMFSDGHLAFPLVASLSGGDEEGSGDLLGALGGGGEMGGDGEDEEEIRESLCHEGSRCHACHEGPIIGPKFKCLSCPTDTPVELCGTCNMTRWEKHSEHATATYLCVMKEIKKKSLGVPASGQREGAHARGEREKEREKEGATSGMTGSLTGNTKYNRLHSQQQQQQHQQGGKQDMSSPAALSRQFRPPAPRLSPPSSSSSAAVLSSEIPSFFNGGAVRGPPRTLSGPALMRDTPSQFASAPVGASSGDGRAIAGAGPPRSFFSNPSSDPSSGCEWPTPPELVRTAGGPGAHRYPFPSPPMANAQQQMPMPPHGGLPLDQGGPMRPLPPPPFADRERGQLTDARRDVRTHRQPKSAFMGGEREKKGNLSRRHTESSKPFLSDGGTPGPPPPQMIPMHMMMMAGGGSSGPSILAPPPGLPPSHQQSSEGRPLARGMSHNPTPTSMAPVNQSPATDHLLSKHTQSETERTETEADTEAEVCRITQPWPHGGAVRTATDDILGGQSQPGVETDDSVQPSTPPPPPPQMIPQRPLDPDFPHQPVQHGVNPQHTHARVPSAPGEEKQQVAMDPEPPRPWMELPVGPSASTGVPEVDETASFPTEHASTGANMSGSPAVMGIGGATPSLLRLSPRDVAEPPFVPAPKKATHFHMQQSSYMKMSVGSCIAGGFRRFSRPQGSDPPPAPPKGTSTPSMPAAPPDAPKGPDGPPSGPPASCSSWTEGLGRAVGRGGAAFRLDPFGMGLGVGIDVVCSAAVGGGHGVLSGLSSGGWPRGKKAGKGGENGGSSVAPP
uniref:PB1 domain-containing protein n=1 Tax=Chromera velia CCMP2878 TaxID=1169474 RepID=A0A0G4H1B7_9ALVE|eukprot:Cvel_24253.t1-p1 / transcript=Cvel_24253.t1 / gene=Cvel_24253 / organism=Chromera_velia_CCMP2878 / gene_product=hypothetical protein / transcript_product=hypothetical protein / location=Cvel_scaffold2598:3590-9412(-) / protein_length=1515 / sequence_SO=supercontig / SO=protein_coding / is_pseudo=false